MNNIKSGITCLSIALFMISLLNAQEAKLMLPVGQTESITILTFSPDGKYILTASNLDNIVSIWETSSGKQVLRLGNINEEIDKAGFSEDGSRIVITYQDKSTKTWSAETGKEVIENIIKGGDPFIGPGKANAAKPKNITISQEGNKVFLVDSSKGNRRIQLQGHTKKPGQYEVSPSGKLIATNSSDSIIRICRVTDGGMVGEIKMIAWYPKRNWWFNADETRVISNEREHTEVFDVMHGRLLGRFEKEKITNGFEITDFSRDGRYMAWGKDLTVKVLDLYKGSVTYLQGHSDKLNSARFDAANNLLLSASWDKYPRIWDLKSGTTIQYFRSGTSASSIGEATVAAIDRSSAEVLSYSVFAGDKMNWWNVKEGVPVRENELNLAGFKGGIFSQDGKTIIAWRGQHILYYQKSEKKQNKILADGVSSVNEALFSPDDQFIATSFDNHLIKLWSNPGQKLISTLKGHSGRINQICFSNDVRFLATGSSDGTANIWQVPDGKLITTIATEQKASILQIAFSPEGDYLVTASTDEKFQVWETKSGKLVATITGHKSHFKFSQNFRVARIIFSADGKYLYTSSGGGMTKKWDARTFNELGSIDNGGLLQDITADSKRLVTIDNAIIHFYNAENLELQLSYLPVDSNDYLVIDKHNRYDGTESARKLLYFTCGTEIIGLDQVKDQLWVPGLAERINNGETINAPTLDELGICGLTPVVTDISKDSSQYIFSILPGKGGLGETAVYINGIEIARYKPTQLTKKDNSYLLTKTKAGLQSYFIPGQKNQVIVKSFTANNDIASRSTIADEEENNSPSSPPNLYAVMIGVSDYKGTDMDLTYAAKDADEMAEALSAAARKLLNTDGREHVFSYKLTTDKERYQLPEKRSIKNLLAEIGKKTKTNDILLIFFAGHGTMAAKKDEKKQFYFLTADASKVSAVGAAEEVGISMAELSEWLKLENMKAGKRILIFDACKSGQAINDLVTIGMPAQQYFAARDEDKAQQVKAIEDLNGKSGLFILSGSSSNQSSYEMGLISHGLLTHSLLRTIKQQPDILDNGKYLDVSRWFNAADKMVRQMSKERGLRQEPQIVSAGSFAVGIVDKDVRATISLPEEKPLFASSNFQNSDEQVSADDISLGKKIDNYLFAFSARGSASPLIFLPNTDTPDAYILSGRYEIKGTSVVVRVNIRKNNLLMSKFEIKGSIEKPDELAKMIADKAAEIVK